MRPFRGFDVCAAGREEGSVQRLLREGDGGRVRGAGDQGDGERGQEAGKELVELVDGRGVV